ncbi:hypothetical protein ANCCAN_00045 [Ancylostoma caninum]|uniref:Uncharacterized protein n=1 Tax=Ancylostoma caninum TaxID=29170 RepID=A0A368HAB9_ANCCA|nr:hypothetical protein ANCCAN_00045 [Ancylostoma caninum]
MPLALAQNPYGPSQLDQYARLLNSGNLGGFGFFQNALAQGTVRGLGDLNPPPLLAGLPPLPLTHEEVMRQLTSTPPPPTTRATAIPTTPSSSPGGVYAVNSMVELPPMPENRIHGTFDDDGVFQPDNKNEKIDEDHIVRNQIQGTKIRDFSQTERDTVEGQTEENPQKDENYTDDESFEDQSVRGSSAAEAHQLAQHSEKTRKPRQNSPNQRHYSQSSPPRRFYDPQQKSRGTAVVYRPTIQREPRYPPFIFRPRPPPAQREPEYNNLLAEIEEYDDFLEQQRVYRSRYPQAALQNPYRDLPAGQLPAAGAYSAQNQQRSLEIPAPRRIANSPNNNWSPQQQQCNFLNWSQPQQQAVTPYPKSATEHPFLNIFNLFSAPHAHALAAPQVNLDDVTLATTTPTPVQIAVLNNFFMLASLEIEQRSKDVLEILLFQPPRPNPYQLGMLPIPAQGIPLVDIQQQPLSFPQLGSPLVLTPLFGHGK